MAGQRQMSAWPGSWLSFSSAEPGPGARGGVLKFFLNIQKCFLLAFLVVFGGFLVLLESFLVVF